jgi:hypothetical protein
VLRDVHLLLENSLRSPARARRAIESLLADVAPGSRYDAALLTSELVTHAVTHARGACSLDATWNGSSLRVEVLNAEAAPPRTDATETPSGLQLVDLLAPRWGVEPATGGEVLWFELDLESSLA